MSKLAYFFITLIGAIPGGFLCYLIVMYFKDQGFGGSTIMQVACWTTLAAAFAIVLTPLMVVFWYKPAQVTAAAPKPAADSEDDEPAPDKKPAKAAKAAKAAKGKKRDHEDDGFEDAIPDDFDEEELEASRATDDFEEVDEENFDYGDDELEDFEDEEEEPQPKKKKKK